MSRRAIRRNPKKIPNDLQGCRGCLMARLKHHDGPVPSFAYGSHKRYDMFIVAEAPGQTEDEKGEPMVGSAGDIQWSLLDYFGLENVAIGNTIRCWPGKGNPDPEDKVITHCLQHVKADILRIKPKAVLLAGKIAAQAMLKSKLSLGKLRGWHKLRLSADFVVDAYVTNHPSAVHYNPDMKSTIESDLLRVVRRLNGDDEVALDFRFSYLTTPELVEKGVDATINLPAGKFVGHDWENTDLRLVDCHPLCISWGWRVKKKGQAPYYRCLGVPLKHPDTPFSAEDFPLVMSHLQRMFRAIRKRYKEGSLILGAHGAKFESAIDRDVLDVVLPQILCTIQAAHAIDENRLKSGFSSGKAGKGGRTRRGIYNLATLSSDWLAIDPEFWDKHTSDLLYSGQGAKTDVKKCTDHCARDVATHVALWHEIENRAAQQEYDIHRLRPLLESTPYLLGTIERNGIPVDINNLAELRSDKGPLLDRMDQIEKELHKKPAVQDTIARLRGGTNVVPIFAKKGERRGFDIRKRKYLASLFYDVLQLPWGEEREQRTKTGLAKIDKEFFSAFKDIEEVALVSEWKQLDKLVSTYIEGWWRLVEASTDNRIRASFNAAGTTTGRLSCFPAGTLVQTKRGFVRIEHIKENDQVATREGYFPVEKQWCTGKHLAYRLMLTNGVDRRVSGSHRYLTTIGWQPVDKLREGTPVFASQRPHLRENSPVNIEDLYEDTHGQRQEYLRHTVFDAPLAEIVGYSVGDGHLRPGRQTKSRGQRYDKLLLALSWDDPDVLDYLKASIERLFGVPVVPGRGTCPTLTVNSTKVCMLLRRFGLHRKSIAARTPVQVWQSPSEVAAAYLRGLYEADGGVGSCCVYLTSSSRKLLRQTQLLLTQFGVITALKPKNDESGFPTAHQRWLLRTLGQRSVQRFNSYVGFLSRRKKTALADLVRQPSFKDRHDLFDLPPGQTKNDMYWAFKRAGYDRLEGKCLAHFFTGRERDAPVTWEWLRRLVDYIPADLRDDPALSLARMVVDQDLTQLKVARVLATSDTVPMYDLAIRGRPEFLVDGVVVHNCKNPNLQQIPKGKTEAARILKRVFRPHCNPGDQDLRVIVSCDLSQAEVRWLAEVSDEPVLRDMYVKRAEMLEQYAYHPSKELATKIKVECDLHRATASEMFGVPILEVTDNQRGGAKAINFGNIYGQTAMGLAALLGVPVEEAEELLKKWLGRFKKAGEWFIWTEEFAKKHGYVESPIGRRRHLDALLLGDIIKRGSALGHLLRVARNAPIQSIASDMNLWIAIKVQQWIDRKKKNWKLMALVHDSIIAEIPIFEVLEYVKIARTIAESRTLLKTFGVNNLIVPQEMEFEVGFNYGEVKTLTTSRMEQEQVVQGLWDEWRRAA